MQRLACRHTIRRAAPSFQVLWDLWQDLGQTLTEWTFVGPLAFSHLFPFVPPGFSVSLGASDSPQADMAFN